MILEAVGEELWVAGGKPVRFLVFDFDTRMTVVRLPGRQLWVHSPVALTPELEAEVRGLGDVAALVAPNDYHHLYVAEWLERWPQARLFGTSQ